MATKPYQSVFQVPMATVPKVTPAPSEIILRENNKSPKDHQQGQTEESAILVPTSQGKHSSGHYTMLVSMDANRGPHFS